MADANRVDRFNVAFGLGVSQAQVDFVIPDLKADLPLCIDPFLLFKSKDSELRQLHERLVRVFNHGIEFFRNGRRADLDRLIDFPEVNEIGFGYTSGRIKGSGLGAELNAVLAETLAASEALQERGLRHVEELQLVSIGVGADRVSDIAANALKEYLVEYTRKQAELWGIPVVRSLPIEHMFDFNALEWTDGYFDLPLNPVTERPMLLVPRRIVRILPWINYEEYARTDFKLFLSPRLPRFPGMARQPRVELAKQEVVRTTREHLRILDTYIARKEREAINAEPVMPTEDESDRLDRLMGDNLIRRLESVAVGQATAAEYQRIIFEIINYLFEPALTDGQLEVRTVFGTERRDIIYTNEGDRSFWRYTRETYGSPLVMFEVKNVRELEIDHINQTANYLGARLGMLGFIVTRLTPSQNIVLKTFAIYNDTPSMPRKIIVTLTDTDLIAMIRQRQSGEEPTQYVQRKYREFRTRVQ